MAYKVQIEVVHPVQDPVSGEVLIQPGTRFEEDAKELDGLPAYMLRAVLAEAEPEPEPVPKVEPKPAVKATSGPAGKS